MVCGCSLTRVSLCLYVSLSLSVCVFCDVCCLHPATGSLLRVLEEMLRTYHRLVDDMLLVDPDTLVGPTVLLLVHQEG